MAGCKQKPSSELGKPFRCLSRDAAQQRLRCIRIPSRPTRLRKRPLPSRPSGPIEFTDVTAQAGIHFKHNSGAFGKKYLPETMGSGVCFLDYDNDGWQDILLRQFHGLAGA